MRSSTISGNEVVLKSGWNSLWTLLSAVALACAAPYFIAKTICKIKLAKNKDTLPGKVFFLYIIITLQNLFHFIFFACVCRLLL